MSEVMGELRVAARTLAKRPLLAAVVAATVALSVGATTAMFTLVRDVLLDPLPPSPSVWTGSWRRPASGRSSSPPSQCWPSS